MMDVKFPYGKMTLLRTYDPRYDTLVLDPSRNGKVVDETLFFAPLGRDPRTGKERHLSDTNMTCAASLGYPLHAVFNWMRVFVEEFENPDDLNWLRRHCSFSMIMGGNTPMRTLSLNAMSPRFPKGGEKLLQKWIEDGVIKAWPWFYALLPSIKIDSTEMFRVHVTSDEVASLKGALRVKVFLGPWLCRQKYDRPRMEECPEDPVDPE